jgi:hypothetical protein
LQVPPKFTQIRIFGLKICHLATLLFAPKSSFGRIFDETFFDEKKTGNKKAGLEPGSIEAILDSRPH